MLWGVHDAAEGRSDVDSLSVSSTNVKIGLPVVVSSAISVVDSIAVSVVGMSPSISMKKASAAVKPSDPAFEIVMVILRAASIAYEPIFWKPTPPMMTSDLDGVIWLTIRE